ncbi:hypothetical protein M0R89_08035 [Halorussus limi]|uniref:Uncharacterized protein n=1 Tax=Halorussus limi TaxID=2938695 RepID=A0A8U0HYJ6_9EURY|nr:hypothetical protein [Halorussus limi]UPV75998.1 hypothetical protein M0R89_08035 [Halorussus limi]
MGTYEDCCFTFRPESRSADEVTAALERFVERPFEDLPDLPDDVAPYSDPKDYFERDRLDVEADPERGQVYLGGRTHRSSNWWAWRYWIRELGIGDGTLALVWWHETPLQGYGELWRWDDATGEYVDVDADLDAENHGGDRTVYLGEEGAQGAKIAERLGAGRAITPARHDEFDGFLRSGDDNFVPLHYRRMHGDE